MYRRPIVPGTLLLFQFVFFHHRCCSSSSEQQHSFPIFMPFVRPRLPEKESYLCTSVTVDSSKPLFITEIEPMVSMETAHHILVVGCVGKQKERKRNLWNCGGGLREEGLEFMTCCQGNQGQQMMYMWSRNASSVRFPTNSAMVLGLEEEDAITTIVLQVHYVNNRRIPRAGDTSGVVVKYVDRMDPPFNRVGILGLHVHGVVMPHSVAKWDAACKLLDPGQVVHPFAFLTHTHKRGLWATGWIVSKDDEGRDKWTLVGGRDPQDPQSFYPTTANLTISPEDTLAARCTLISTESVPVYQGLTAGHEMCDYFIMYWVEGGDRPLPKRNGCTTKHDFTWAGYGLKDIPAQSIFGGGGGLR